MTPSGVVNINDPSAATYMQFPFAQSFPSPSGGLSPRVVPVSYSGSLDSGTAAEQLVTQRSVDGGKIFTPLPSEVPISSMAQLAGGSLVAEDYRTTVAGPNVLATRYWRSGDYGATRTHQAGIISTTGSTSALYFQRGMVRGRDGSLLAAVYGTLTGDPKFRSLLARSTDGGATWQIKSTIASASPGLPAKVWMSRQ
jgi:hypothetical protein